MNHYKKTASKWICEGMNLTKVKYFDLIVTYPECSLLGRLLKNLSKGNDW